MKKTNVWKRVAAMLAAVVVTFTTGVSAYANEASDLWYAGQDEAEMKHYYAAYDYFLQAMGAEGADQSNNRALLCQKLMEEMYQTKNYWNVEQIYMSSQNEYGVRSVGMKAYYGDCLYNSGKYREAQRAYELLKGELSDNPAIVASLDNMIGECNLKARQFDAAMENFADAYKVQQDAEDYCERLLRVHFAMGETDVESMNIPVFEELSNLQKANALQGSAHSKEALPYYQAAIAEGEDVACNYSYALSNVGMYEEALEEANRLLALDESNADVWGCLGSIYGDGLCQHEKALECFEKAYELAPDSKYTLPNTLVALRKMGDREALLAQARLVQEKFPMEMSGYETEIRYTKDITAEEALAILGRYPDFPKDAELQGQLLLRSVSLDTMTPATLESFLTYVDGMIGGPAGSNYYYMVMKAGLLQKLGRYEEAILVAQETLEVSGCLERGARWELADILEEAGQSEEAADELALISINLLDFDANAELAKNFIQAGKYVEGFNVAKSHEEYGDMEGALRLEVESYFFQEDYETALELVEKGLSVNPDSAIFKAFKVAIMQELDMEGTEELIAEIDQIKYSNESLTRLAIDSLLGRYEDAMIVAQTYMDWYPGYMTSIRQSYRYANLCHSQEYADLVGAEYVPEVKEAKGQKEDVQSVFQGEEEEGGNSNVPWLPYAAGGVGLVALVGIGVALVAKKK